MHIKTSSDILQIRERGRKKLLPENGRIAVGFGTCGIGNGAQEIVAWHDADPARRAVDPRMNRLFDRLIEAYRPRPI